MEKAIEDIFKEKFGIYEDENELSKLDIQESGEVTIKDLEGEK